MPKDSVANVSQILSLDRGTLIEHVATLSEKKLKLVMTDIDTVLGRRAVAYRKGSVPASPPDRLATTNGSRLLGRAFET